MDKKTLEKFQIILEKEKNKLEKQLAVFAKPNKDIRGDYKTEMPQIGDDEDENATEIAMYSNKLSLEYDFENRLSKVNKALRKIKKGSYGICEKCKRNINMERLGVYPEARFCMKCHDKKST